MPRPKTIERFRVITAGLYLVLVSSFVLDANRVEANDPASEQKLDNDFIVHEWGTFTTFSGSDGVYLDYRPLATDHSDLPSFVLDRLSGGNGNGFPVLFKQRVRARVRMETPVTYFYTDKPRKVSVRVDFPKGMLTEYYPPAKKILPPLDRNAALGKGELIGDSSIDWGQIDLIPTNSVISESIPEPLRSRLRENLTNSMLPQDPKIQHYGQARATDSALVHVQQRNEFSAFNNWSLNQPQDFFEKFLFYRGVGKFELPVAVEFDQRSATFTNRGQDEIRSVIMLEVRNGKMRMNVVDKVAAESSQTFGELSPASEQDLENTLVQRLAAEGLYDKEARAMVSTWKSSWFAEDGRRVLYMVPGNITDELLPLHVKPTPKESLRVLVARMELLSQEDEQELLTQIRESLERRNAFIADPGNKGKTFPFPQGIASYGRMAEPALARVATIAKDATVRREAKLLLAQIRASVKLTAITP
ncbi:MAG: hypothetical protein AAFX06_18705 [Planctomycetota bacterium]